MQDPSPAHKSPASSQHLCDSDAYLYPSYLSVALDVSPPFRVGRDKYRAIEEKVIITKRILVLKIQENELPSAPQERVFTCSSVTNKGNKLDTQDRKTLKLAE